MNCEIITIGDEILIGQIVDTNSPWMATELNELGISIHRISSVQDGAKEIKAAFTLARNDVDLVLVTGGLGPTKDDITKQIVCDFFNTELTEDATVLAHVTQLIESRGMEMNELNAQQSWVPASATVLQNRVGTAPCLWLEKAGTIFVFMPGVPFEMKTIMSEEVLPRLQSRFQLQANYHVTLQTYGIPEAKLAELLTDWENNLPTEVKLAYLPNPKGIRLRLSHYGEVSDRDKVEFEKQIQKLQQTIPEALYGREEETLSSALGKMLKEHGKTVTVAESCTGGNIAHYLTSIPGSSAYFNGSIVSYSNEIKERVLGVSSKSLNEFGAVSQSVVEQMAQGARKLMNADYAIATSGVAGPEGGTVDKPVGTVWFAIDTPEGTFSLRKQFGDHRGRNITRSTQTGLNFLRTHLVSIYGLPKIARTKELKEVCK